MATETNNNDEKVISQVIVTEGTGTTFKLTGRSDRVAIIGAFPTVSTEVEHYTSLRAAREGLKIIKYTNDKYNAADQNITEATRKDNYFKGAGCIKRLFREGETEKGANEVIVVNTSTYIPDSEGGIKCKTGATTDKDGKTTTCECPLLDVTLDKEVDSKTHETKLDNALKLLKGENFDILFVAYELTLEEIKKIVAFTSSKFKLAAPVGLIGSTGINQSKYSLYDRSVASTTTSGSTTSVVESVIEKQKSIYNTSLTALKNMMDVFAGKKFSLYSFSVQGVYLDYEDECLTPLETAAYICGVVAGTNVDKSLTAKQFEHVVGVDEELIFEEGSDGYDLTEMGILTFRLINRNSKTYDTVNSMLPSKYDIAHIRTAAYVVQNMGIRKYLGRHTGPINQDDLKTQLESVKDVMLTKFNIIDSIDYNILERKTNYIKIGLTIYVYGILIEEEVVVDVEVI